MEKDLSAAGWTFFYMASAVTATAFGFDRTKNDPYRSAACHHEREPAEMQQSGDRCRVDALVLGLPCVSLTAHLRHIQKGVRFCDAQPAPGSDPIATAVHSGIRPSLTAR